MLYTPATLLKRLEPPLRPGASARTTAANDGFDTLLQLVSTGTPVGASVKLNGVKELDESQQQRLAAAADLALSGGLNRVVVALDGRHFVVLVTDGNERRIESELSPSSTAVLTEAQALIHAADPNSEPIPSALRPPGGMAPASVQRSIDQFNSSPGFQASSKKE
jgi:hypothetical protein